MLNSRLSSQKDNDYIDHVPIINNNFPVFHSNFNFFKKVSRLLLGFDGPFNETEAEVLGYMACYNANGIYRSLPGKRIELTERLGISIKTYERTIAKLLEKKLIKQVRFTGSYVGYELPEAFLQDKITIVLEK